MNQLNFGTIQITQGTTDGLDLATLILATDAFVDLLEVDFSNFAPAGTIRILEGVFVTHDDGPAVFNSVAFPDDTEIILENYGTICGYGGAGGAGSAASDGVDGEEGAAGEGGLAGIPAHVNTRMYAEGGEGGLGGTPGRGSKGGLGGAGANGSNGQNAIELTKANAGDLVVLEIDNANGYIWGGGGGGGGVGGAAGSRGGNGNAIGGKGGKGGAGAPSVDTADEGTDGIVAELPPDQSNPDAVATYTYNNWVAGTNIVGGDGGTGGTGGTGASGGGGGGGLGGHGGHGGFPLGDGGDGGAGGVGGDGGGGAVTGTLGSENGDDGSAGIPGCNGTIDHNNYDKDHSDYIPVEEIELTGACGGAGADIGTAGETGIAGGSSAGQEIGGLAGDNGELSIRVDGDPGDDPIVYKIYQGVGGGPGMPGKCGRYVRVSGKGPIAACGRGGNPGFAIQSGGALIKFDTGVDNVKGLII